MTDGHGDDAYRYGGRVAINFSTNICQSADHTALLAHLARRGDIFSNYPEPEPRSVERLLAAEAGVDEANVIVTNGATEAIYLLAQAFAPGPSAIVGPTFREYQDACRLFGHDLAFVGSLGEITAGMRMVWLCNPDNPTGRAIHPHDLARCAAAHPDTIFVIDQAYADYSVKPSLDARRTVALANVVSLHSLTKRFAIPGLRIGYAVGPRRLIDAMRARRMPWSVNAVAIEAARYLLAHAGDYRIDARGLNAEALRIAAAMRSMGIEAGPTDCNFILCRLPRGRAADLKEWLVDNHGLLIRDASNFTGLTPGHFRVAAQSAPDNDTLINAISQWISS